MNARNPTVIKLGGSHAFAGHLAEVVAAIAAARLPVVVVPGGGPFADAVREAQSRIGFADDAAHRMALLAMCQFGEVLASLHARLRPANGIARIRATLADGAVPVWMPWPLADGLDAVRPSWDITSDSLAAWLAARLGAERLILVKSAEPPSAPVSAGELARTGMIDPAFPAYFGASHFPAWWIGPSAIRHLTCVLDGEGEYGAQIVMTGTAAMPASTESKPLP